MALRIKKDIIEKLAAARKGDTVDLSQIVVPRIGGGLISRAPDDGEPRDTVRRFQLSDKSQDRDRDTIDPSGWDLKDFLKNGPILWAHNSYGLPIAEPGETGVEGKGEKAALFGDARFIEDYDFSKLVLMLIDEKALKNASVGFGPVEWVFNEERRGIDFIKQKLVEWSVTPIGSNINAMVQLAKSHDLVPMLDWSTKWLDNDEKIGAAIADDIEVAAIQKALMHCAPSIDPGVVPEPEKTPDPVPEPEEKAGRVLSKKNKDKLHKISTLAGEILASAEKEESEEGGDDDGKSTVVLSVKGFDYLLECVPTLDISDGKREQLTNALTEAKSALSQEPELDLSGMDEDTLRAAVDAAVAKAVKSGNDADEGTPISLEEAVELVDKAITEMILDIQRETGRLPR